METKGEIYWKIKIESLSLFWQQTEKLSCVVFLVFRHGALRCMEAVVFSETHELPELLLY